MFLWKLVKGFIKFVFFLIIGVIFIVWLISAFVTYKNGTEMPFQNVSYMMTSYEKNAEVPRGTWCQCPVCDEYYYKGDYACCSAKCEREYHDLVKAWNSANRDKQFIENHGKKFK